MLYIELVFGHSDSFSPASFLWIHVKVAICCVEKWHSVRTVPPAAYTLQNLCKRGSKLWVSASTCHTWFLDYSDCRHIPFMVEFASESSSFNFLLLTSIIQASFSPMDITWNCFNHTHARFSDRRGAAYEWQTYDNSVFPSFQVSSCMFSAETINLTVLFRKLFLSTA